MTDINVKIAAKGCDNTGITDELAARLHANLGHKIVAVVELVSEARTEKRDGKETVSLSILTLEPAPDSMTAEHLRELARAFHYERRLDQGDPGQLRLGAGDDIEPKVSEVLAAGNRHRPHPFLPDDAGKEQPICDVCGGIEASAVHSMQDALDVDDPDEPEQGDDEELVAGTDPDLDTGDGLDEEDEPHAFISEDDTDICRLCGRFEADGQGIHVTDGITPEMSDLARSARKGLGVIGDVMAEHGPDGVKEGMKALDDIAAANEPDSGGQVVELPTTLANPFNPTPAGA